MHRHKAPNLYEVVIDFSSFNADSIVANNSFANIDFTNNKND